MDIDVIKRYAKVFRKLICYVTYQEIVSQYKRDNPGSKVFLKDPSVLISYANKWFNLCKIATTKPRCLGKDFPKDLHAKDSSKFVKVYGRDLQAVIRSYFYKVWSPDEGKQVSVTQLILKEVCQEGIIRKRSHINFKGFVSLPNCYYLSKGSGQQYFLDNIDKIGDLNCYDFYTKFEAELIQKCCNVIYKPSNKAKQTVKAIDADEAEALRKADMEVNKLCEEANAEINNTQTIPPEDDLPIEAYKAIASTNKKQKAIIKNEKQDRLNKLNRISRILYIFANKTDYPKHYTDTLHSFNLPSDATEEQVNSIISQLKLSQQHLLETT